MSQEWQRNTQSDESPRSRLTTFEIPGQTGMTGNICDSFIPENVGWFTDGDVEASLKIDISFTCQLCHKDALCRKQYSLSQGDQKCKTHPVWTAPQLNLPHCNFKELQDLREMSSHTRRSCSSSRKSEAHRYPLRPNTYTRDFYRRVSQI